jgi:Spy/CpxP family protein refolding chaperone
MTSFAAVLLIAASSAYGRQHDHAGEGDAAERSPYADFTTREIASLSPADVDELLAGEGWGFALPAELNGLPGPRHVLDMGEKLALDEDQRVAIQRIFDDMNARAVKLGQLFVERERALNRFFLQPDRDASRLSTLVDSAGAVRSSLRSVHLGAHLTTAAVLTPDQIASYNRLRGYSSGDPCQNVPEGHDPDMWRRHNGCDG